ncbi:MAG TPA: 1-acyl-sn-glycerol-3-phosphate acyltransferase [Tetragenococcus sp.]|nr:1-acyl-sn-glycerol-3-phosphate acyltransferase [Tetragenococcus sp.]
MFYSFARYVLQFIAWLINGKVKILQRNNLPKKGNYIVIAPHRTLWDAVYLALAVWPKRCIFMAKKELFEIPVLGFFLRHGKAFAVDRDHPQLSSIKQPINHLKNSSDSLIMFPGGALHESSLKAGAALIAKRTGLPIIPAVYQGPLTFGGLFKRKQITIAFGKAIKIGNEKDALKTSQQLLQHAFDTLDQMIDPDFVDEKLH